MRVHHGPCLDRHERRRKGCRGHACRWCLAMARCQWPFPIVATRLIVIVVFTLDVTVEDFILVDNVADMSQLLGLSGELERDLELR